MKAGDIIMRSGRILVRTKVNGARLHLSDRQSSERMIADMFSISCSEWGAKRNDCAK